MSEEVKQGTPVWHNARRLGIGGSEIAIILGESPWRTPYDLWLEKTGKKISEDIGNLPHVQRGVLGEKICRMILEREHLKSFTPKTWTIPETPWRCSDDGFNEELGVLLEIKCMGQKAHSDIKKTNTVPEHYRLQVQYNLAVSGCKTCWFISFQPETEELHKVIVTADLDEGAKLKQAALVFWQTHVETGIAPDLQEGDFVEVKDSPSMEAAALEYREASVALALAEDRAEKAKQSLSSYLHDNVGIRGYGVVIQKTTRRGMIDYNRVPLIAGVDLECYRKPSTTSIRVSLDRRKPTESQLWPQVKP